MTSSKWLTPEQRRLDASAFAEGGQAIRHRIQQLRAPVERLDQVARLYNEARFARTYVPDPAHGFPYLTGSDMLLVDLTGLLYISRAKTPQARRLQVGAGWTLISCSGTVGRTVYARSEMAGFVLSHDVIRAIPALDGIQPGYLFAFLSTRHAQAMLRQRMYGSVVQHIEPAHIADLPVPIPDDREGKAIDALVRSAADGRTTAAALLHGTAAHFDSLAPGFRYGHEHERAEAIASSTLLHGRLDAFHHAGWAAEAAEVGGDHISALASVSRPSLIKRVFVDRGIPFVSGVDVYHARPSYRSRIMTREAERAAAFIHAGQLLVQRSGQRYGLLGRPALVGRSLDGFAASEDLIRVSPTTPAAAARIFSFLRSDLGRRTLLRTSYGTSIPHLNPDGVAGIRVPALPTALQAEAEDALRLRELADAAEEEAIQRIEAWLDS